jgi:hypothetical protein
VTSSVRRETRGGPYTVKSQNLCAPFFEPRRNIVENLASDMSFERSRHAAAAIGVSARIHYTLGTATHMHTNTYTHTRKHTHAHTSICIKLLFLIRVRFPLSPLFFIRANGFHTTLTRQKILFFHSSFLEKKYKKVRIPTWYDNNIYTLYKIRTYTLRISYKTSWSKIISFL